MSKLFKLKEYLLLDEAIAYLSSVLEEEVSIADIYQLALGYKITISVKFDGFIAVADGRIFDDNSEKKTHTIEIDRDFFTNAKLDKPYLMNKSDAHLIKSNGFVFFDKELTYTSGIFDLSMEGSELSYIKHLYKESIGAHSSGLMYPSSGIILQNHNKYCLLKSLNLPSHIDEREKFHLMENAKNEEFHNCVNLKDHDHLLVIRTRELTRVIQSLEGKPEKEPKKAKPLVSNERNSLLILIAALCKEADVDWNQRGITASLAAMTDLLGVTLNDDTIRKIVKQIEPAITSRSK